MKLKEQVEWVLQNNPETRNSDITLTIEIWRRYFPGRIITGKDGRDYVALQSLYDVAREDNVKRIRAKFNSQGKYMPTKLEIAQKRGIKEEQWRESLGYPRRTETYYPSKKPSYTDEFSIPKPKQISEQADIIRQTPLSFQSGS